MKMRDVTVAQVREEGIELSGLSHKRAPLKRKWLLLRSALSEPTGTEPRARMKTRGMVTWSFVLTREQVFL